jgi:inner membrane transporter RhtA
VFPRLSACQGRSDGLSLAMGCAALLTVPYWLANDPGRIFTLRNVLLGAAVALLSDVLAYSLQSEALDRMPGSLFSILTSTEPAAGALIGLIALGQQIGLPQWAGMLAVVAASAGATITRSRAEPPPEEPEGPGGLRAIMAA